MYDEIEMFSRSGHKHGPRSQSQGQLNSVDRDRAELHRLGKKPVLRVRSPNPDEYFPKDLNIDADPLYL